MAMPTSGAERSKEYRRRKRARAANGTSLLRRPDFAAATAEYKKAFLDVEFGLPCASCGRAWFANGLRVS